MSKDIETNAFALFGACVLLQRLEALSIEIEGTRKAEDIEYLHRMRIASRRLRAALSLFKKGCFPKKNQYRTYRPGIERLLLRLRQHRESLQQPLLQTIDHFEESDVIGDMQKTPNKILVSPYSAKADAQTPEVFQQAFPNITQKIKKVLAYEPFVDDPERQQEHHAIRINAKRLRYTLEIFNPIFDDRLKPYIKQVKHIQSILGEIHDCDVWIEFIPQFIEEEHQRTLEYFGHDRSFKQLLPGLELLKTETRQQRYKEFVKDWHQMLETHLFEELYETAHQAQEQEYP